MAHVHRPHWISNSTNILSASNKGVIHTFCMQVSILQVRCNCLFIDIEKLTHSAHSNPFSLHLTIKFIQMLPLRQWEDLCNTQIQAKIQSFSLMINSKPASQADKSISINATSLVNLYFCYKPKVFARYSIHSINRKICDFCVCSVWSSAAGTLSLTKHPYHNHSPFVTAQRSWRRRVLLVLRCRYGRVGWVLWCVPVGLCRV